MLTFFLQIFYFLDQYAHKSFLKGHFQKLRMEIDFGHL